MSEEPKPTGLSAPTIDQEMEEGREVIAHFPVTAAESSRPILPSTEQGKSSWTLSVKTGRRTAFVFALVALVTFFIILVNSKRQEVANPVHNLRLKELKQEVAKNITLYEASEDLDYVDQMKAVNAELIQEIRKLDLALRQYFFGLKKKEEVGAWILFASLVGFFLTLRSTRFFTPDIPLPVPDFEKGEEQLREKSWGRLGMVVFTVGCFSLFGFLHLMTPNPPGMIYTKVIGTGEVEFTGPIPEEAFARNWPWFGGYSSNPLFNDAQIPLRFDTKTNVRWSSSIPMGGASIPIVWEKQVFITAANKTKRALYAFDIRTGKQKWSVSAKSDKSKEVPNIYDDYILASSAPATDGRRVYAIFANGDLIATDLKGKLLWQKDLGSPENDYGHSIALVIYKENVIVQWDNDSPNAGIYMYRGEDGEEIMKIERKGFGASWRNPVVFRDEEHAQLITSAEKLMGHELPSGRLIWEREGMIGDLGSGPIFEDGIVYTLTSDMFGALRPSKDGMEMLWETDDLAIPDISNAVIKGNRIWTLDSGGVICCLDKATGKLIYEHELNMEIYASPVIVDNRIYIFGIEGEVHVVGTGDRFQSFALNKLGVPLLATPVIHKDLMLVRSDKTLYAFGK